jgi:hypothetical protein
MGLVRVQMDRIEKQTFASNGGGFAFLVYCKWLNSPYVDVINLLNI